MSKRKYRDEAEGTIYPRIDNRVIDGDWVGRFKAKENRDFIGEARKYCARILSELSGEVVEIRGSFPYVGNRILEMPWPGEECIDIVRDVESCLQACNQVENFRNILRDTPSPPSQLERSLGPGYLKLSIDYAIELGLWLERLRIRWAGFERAALVGLDQIQRPAKMKAAAIKAKGGITAQQQKERAEALYRDMRRDFPQLSTKAIRQRIATELGIDGSTLRRYLPAKRTKEIENTDR